MDNRKQSIIFAAILITKIWSQFGGKFIKNFLDMLKIDERMQIRAELPSGSIVKIAEMAGVPLSSVSSWFAGRTNSKHIEDCVFMYIIQERKDREEKLKALGFA